MRCTLTFPVALLIIPVTSAYAQSPLGTGKSDGSLNIASQAGLDGFVQANFAQPSFKLAFRADTDTVNAERAQSGTRRPHAVPTLGLDLSANPATEGSNTATLWNQNDLGIGGTVTASVSFANLATARMSADDVRRLDIVKDIQSFDDQITDISKPNVSADQVRADMKIVNTNVPDIVGNLQALRGTSDEIKSVGDSLRAFNDIFQTQGNALIAALSAPPPAARQPDSRAATMAAAIAAIHAALTQLEPAIAQYEEFRPAPEGPGSLTWDTLSLLASYVHDQYTLLDTSAAFANQLSKKNFDGWSAKAAYNAQWGQLAGGPVILGIAGGLGLKNNSASLTSVNIQDTLFSSSSNQTIRNAIKSTNALDGTFRQSTAGVLDLDCVLKPRSLDTKNRVGVDVFGRASYASTNFVNPGVALFVSPPGQPLNVTGAIAVVRNSSDRAEIDLVAGSNF